VNGVSGPAGMPSWVADTDIIYFDQLSNASAIKQSDISRQNKLLLAIIHKIFFQRGAGREEAALRKGGYGQEYSAKVVGKILTLLMREGVVDRHKGNDGWIYAPVRSATARMNKIRSELSLSNDSIWREVSEIKD
jgi:phosphoglucomutase